MNKLKKYRKNHFGNNLGVIIQDYNNQRHRMHVIQASEHFLTKHVGSKSLKQIMSGIN